jgi:thiol:disulfide interchange protein DsbD
LFKKTPIPMLKRPVVLFFLTTWVVIMMLAIVTFPSLASADEAFLDAGDAFSLSVQPPAAGSRDTRLTWTIAPGYYLYRTRISAVEEASKQPVPLTLPAGEAKNDPNFGTVEVYHHTVSTAIASSGGGAFTVTWQGCADAGLCYPPQHRTVTIKPTPVKAEAGAKANDHIAGGAADILPAAASAAAAADTPATSATPAADAAPIAAPGIASLIDAVGNSDSSIGQLLNQKSLYWALPVFLLLGVALAFTPCVLPMLPIVSSIVMGRQTKPKQAFMLSLAFVVPMALVYAGLGMGAAMAGANLQAALQNRWAILAFGALFAILALPMFDVFTFQLPSFLRDRLDHASQRQQRGRYIGAAGMGALSALMVGPCMTAPLAGILLYIAQGGDVAKGGALLFALGIGMGLPLIAISVLGARSLPKPGLWMERVKGGFGFLMLGVSIWMLERVLPGSLVLLLWGAWLIGIALTLLHILRHRKSDTPAASGALRIAGQCLCTLAFLWGASAIVGAAGGATDPLQPIAFAANGRGVASASATASAPALSGFAVVKTQDEFKQQLAEAQAGGQPALVDFYADWCISCKGIDKEVFESNIVLHALNGFKLIRVDVTDNNPSVQALMRDKGILGPPTVMLFNESGAERRDARLVGEFKPDDLMRRLRKGTPS